MHLKDIDIYLFLKYVTRRLKRLRSNHVQAMETANVSQTANPQTVQIPATNKPTIGSPTAVRFYTRNKLFKAAMGCLVLCTILFIIGFSAPAWIMEDGLWMTCYGGDCHLLAKKQTDWFNAVRAMECLALIAHLFCLMLGRAEDYVIEAPFEEENRALEILAFLAGSLGHIGIMIYGAEFAYFNGNYGTYVFNGHIVDTTPYFNWGFGLVAGACSLTLVCAACIAYSRDKYVPRTSPEP